MPNQASAKSLTPAVTLKLDRELVRPYADALRLLRREMGRNAPTLEELLEHEFSHRTVKIIVDDYLEGGAKRPQLKPNSVRIYRGRRRLRDL
jgi:hypothetical protein